MGHSPTRNSELQTEQHFQVLLIAGQSFAQRALQFCVALATELRAELIERALVRGDLVDDEVGTGACPTGDRHRTGANRVPLWEPPALLAGDRLEALERGLLLSADLAGRGPKLRS